VPEEAVEEPPRAGPKGKALPWDNTRILFIRMVRLEVVGNFDRESAIASTVAEPTIHTAGINGTARNRTAYVKSVAGMRKNANENTGRILKISSVMLPPRLRGENGSEKCPGNLGRTPIPPLRMCPTARRGHAAKMIL
jgi:hypothetical protein